MFFSFSYIFTWMIPLMTYSFRFLPEHEAIGYITNTFNKHVANVTDVPYHVLVVYKTVYCSGSLIGSRIVLTAASCLNNRNYRKTYHVKLGSSTISGQSPVIPVIEVKIHEYYGYRVRTNNDIALLMLKDNAPLGGNVKKIVLIEPDIALRTGISLLVSGWASTNFPKFANNLLWSDMTVMDQTSCQNVYGTLITQSNFCTKYQPERRLSDNGGPATYRDLLVGVLSFGGTKHHDPHVAVFTNVSYFHRWIIMNCKRLLEKYCTSPEYYHTSYENSHEKNDEIED